MLSWIKEQEGKTWSLIVSFQFGEESQGFPVAFVLGQVFISIFFSDVKNNRNSKISNLLDDLEMPFFFFKSSNTVMMLRSCRKSFTKLSGQKGSR